MTRSRVLAAFLVAIAASATLAHAADAPAAPARDRVLLLLGKGFNVGEFQATYYALRAAGYNVDIATNEPGDIEAGSKNRALDIPAKLVKKVEDIKPGDYFALAIPGGHSPGNLEKTPVVLDIVKSFAEAKKPMAAICHGPRLLARAGALKGRNATSLWKVKDELPDQWAAGDFGTYLDLPVVFDHNIVTSRYPNDAVPFATGMLQNFERHGGLATPTGTREVTLIAAGIARDEKFILGPLMQAVSVRTTIVEKAEDLAKVDPATLHALIIADTKGNAALKPEELSAIATKAIAAGKPVYAPESLNIEGAKPLPAETQLAPGSLAQLLAGDITARSQGSRQLPSDTKLKLADIPDLSQHKAPYSVAIALAPQFDDATYAELTKALAASGHSIVIVADKKEPLRGLAGTTVTPTATYSDTLSLKDKPLIIAPGGLFAEEKFPAHKDRMAFLTSQYNAGATLISIGFDSYYVSKDTDLGQSKDWKYASSDQTVWSFDKEKGGYSSEKARKTADRFFTAKDATAVPDLLKLLDAK